MNHTCLYLDFYEVPSHIDSGLCRVTCFGQWDISKGGLDSSLKTAQWSWPLSLLWNLAAQVACWKYATPPMASTRHRMSHSYNEARFNIQPQLSHQKTTVAWMTLVDNRKKAQLSSAQIDDSQNFKQVKKRSVVLSSNLGGNFIY